MGYDNNLYRIIFCRLFGQYEEYARIRAKSLFFVDKILQLCYINYKYN